MRVIQRKDNALEKEQLLQKNKKNATIGNNSASAYWNHGSKSRDTRDVYASKFQGTVDEQWLVDTLSFEANRTRNL